MTPGTGKRSYQACLRCRRRKTKCNLDGAGLSRRPPCVSCHHSGSECVLVASRRGGNFRSRRRANSTEQPPGPCPETENGSELCSPDSVLEDEETIPACTLDIDNDDYERQVGDENLAMELRNPSDALQILARSDEGRALSQGKTSTMVLDDYELVQRGLLHPSILPELLLIFAKKYHPYCPIVPGYLLGPSAMEKIQKSDYFLLTVLLTIASRDSPNHSLTHRYCWDHTQRLLLEVLLTHPWAQTPRTVEGLLLLAEWLPHIQIEQTSSEAPKSLFSEDRTAWSLVGLAVRQGYLLRLDRTSFRHVFNKEPRDEENQKRLIWTFVYLADRQISVRLGQSFWSRGPSMSSKFTAKDFPSLKPVPGVKDEDYASVLEATLELTQMMYNAHMILHSSTERTVAMIYDGDYPCYLDEFQRSAATWQTKWQDIKVPGYIKSTLLLIYEYISLYVNAFAFQAVLTRTSGPRSPLGRNEQTSKRPLADLFSRGVMLSPDGPYIFDAIRAAKKLLKLMNGLDPGDVLCYMPSRYHLYGVYAAVFLHKAQSAGAFQTVTENQEVTGLGLKFISAMEKASSIESHICHGYSRMLKRLWYRRDGRRATSKNTDLSRGIPSQNSPIIDSPSPRNNAESTGASVLSSAHQRHGQTSSMGLWDGFEHFTSEAPIRTLDLGTDITAFPSIEEYLFGSFLPGITGLGRQGDPGTNAEVEQTRIPDPLYTI